MATGSLDYLREQLEELERAGTALHPRVLELHQAARTRFDGRDVINLASNNYLGLAAHPRLKEAAARAAMDFGAGSGAVRTIAGTMAPGRRQLLITDGVFSMDGDIAPLPDLVEVAERHGAIMMIDDAHASGVLGPGGKGTVGHFGLDPSRVDVQVGTLSKAIGVMGGFIAGPSHLIQWLVNRGRPFLFSTSAPPAVASACIAALDVMRDEPERIQRLWSNTNLFKKGLHDLGFDTGASETPITPVIAGEETKAVELSRLLWEEAVFTPAIVFPTVAKGQARVRTIVTADHTDEDLREALEAFGLVGRKLGLI